MRRLCAAALALAAAGVAAQPKPTEPSLPHERLAFFEGDWTTADATPGAFRETCAWLPERRRHMVCRARWNTPEGAYEGLSIFSYDYASGDYLYHGFRSGGAVVPQRGRPDGAGWLFTSERAEAKGLAKTRVAIQPAGDGNGFDFVLETALGEGPWEVRARTRYVRLAK